MSEINVFKALDYIREHAPKYAQAKANRVYLEEYRKTIKATVMREHIDLPVTAQEREAYADDRYRANLEALRIAVEEEEKLRFMIEGARLKIEVFRTLEANKRIEAKTI